MGRILLVSRLVARDLRRHPGQALLLLVVIAAAMATLTLGLILHGVTSQPYEQTRAATAGPDVVASSVDFPASALGRFATLAHAPGVTAHSGPYPVAWLVLRTNGITADAMAEGRDETPAPVDQPKVIQGTWVRGGGVVVERAFADALGLDVGDHVTLDGRTFPVTGIAVTAAAPAFVTEHRPPPGADLQPLTAWQSLSGAAATLVASEQQVLLPASWLLALLAMATVAVVAGGRMAEQEKRVGLLKAAGGTPPLAAAVLLAEHMIVALAAAGAGLAVGWLAAPLLTSPGASLVGVPGAPSLSPTWATVLDTRRFSAIVRSLGPPRGRPPPRCRPRNSFPPWSAR